MSLSIHSQNRPHSTAARLKKEGMAMKQRTQMKEISPSGRQLTWRELSQLRGGFHPVSTDTLNGDGNPDTMTDEESP